ncbi:MmpS family transport accessory protein [Kribbella sp. WER1]
MSQYQQGPQDPHEPYRNPQMPPPGWQPPPPPKKKHTVRNVLLIIGGVVVLLVVVALIAPPQNTGTPGAGSSPSKTAAGKPTAAATTTAPAKPKDGHVVVYKVAGTAKAASLTYTIDGSTSMEQASDQRLPWSKQLTVKSGPMNAYQVSAQNSGTSGTVVCSIVLDGVQVKTATATGAYAIASCDHFGTE